MKVLPIVIWAGLVGMGETAWAQDETPEDVFDMPSEQTPPPSSPASEAPEAPNRYAIPYQMPYEPGMPIPEGGKIVHHFRWGWLTAGIITFGVPYTLSVLAKLVTSANYGELFVPVAGPLLTLTKTNGSDGLLVLNSVTQAAGLTMMIVGFIGRDYLEGWTISDKPGLTVQPHLQGMNLTYRY